MAAIFRVHIPVQEDAAKAFGILLRSGETSALSGSSIFTITERQLKALTEAGVAFDFLKETDETAGN